MKKPELPYKRSNNTSGVTGVHLHHDRRRGTTLWRARVGSRELGEFPTYERAVAARREAEVTYFRPSTLALGVVTSSWNWPQRSLSEEACGRQPPRSRRTRDSILRRSVC